jgi:hypothetical protein
LDTRNLCRCACVRARVQVGESAMHTKVWHVHTSKRLPPAYERDVKSDAIEAAEGLCVVEGLQESLLLFIMFLPGLDGCCKVECALDSSLTVVDARDSDLVKSAVQTLCLNVECKHLVNVFGESKKEHVACQRARFEFK